MRPLTKKAKLTENSPYERGNQLFGVISKLCILSSRSLFRSRAYYIPYI